MSKDILSKLVIKNITGVSRIHSKPNTITLKKNRPQWAIAIKTHGATKYICNGKEYISDNQNIMFLSKGASYTWQSTNGECLMIDFDSDLTSDSIYSFNIKNNSKIIELFQKIEFNHISKKNFYEIKNLQHLYKIIVILLDSEHNKYVPSQKRDIISPAIRYIAENYNNPDINIEMLSNMCGISYVYFREIFSEFYKHPPMEYVNKIRMTRAKEMLESDYNSVEAIAHSVGYNSIYHFSKMFKKSFGVSPSQYNKKISGR